MVKNEEKIRFENISFSIMGKVKESSGIGTLSEKTVHAVVKKFYEEDETYHEVKVGRYYADICSDEDNTENYMTDIVEIQTANFNKLRGKLDYFLENKSVTIVYPIPYKKTLYWVDPTDGRVSKGRKSPKTGSPYQAFKELYKIKNFLINPNLHIHILLMNVDEYRFLDGWSSDRKKGSSRSDRIPVELYDIIRIDSVSDFEKLIPDIKEEVFTFLEFSKAAKITDTLSRIALNVLTYTETVERIGKKGNTILYRKK